MRKEKLEEEDKENVIAIFTVDASSLGKRGQGSQIVLGEMGIAFPISHQHSQRERDGAYEAA